MERKSSTLSSTVDNHKNTNSRDQQVKKVKPPRRWFNSIMTVEIVGICICLGLMIAKAIVK